MLFGASCFPTHAASVLPPARAIDTNAWLAAVTLSLSFHWQRSCFRARHHEPLLRQTPKRQFARDDVGKLRIWS